MNVTSVVVMKAYDVCYFYLVEHGGSAVESWLAIERAWVRIRFATVLKFGHFCSLHDTPVHSAV